MYKLGQLLAKLGYDTHVHCLRVLPSCSHTHVSTQSCIRARCTADRVEAVLCNHRQGSHSKDWYATPPTAHLLMY